MKIKAVLFDADGVVIHPRMQFSRYLEEVFSISPHLTRDFFTGVFNDCLAGRADLPAALPPYLQQWGWPGDLSDFLRLWMAKDDCPDLRLLARIQQMRASGLLCGLATLQEKTRAAYMRADMGFSRRFDRLYFSCELGCLKPDPAFYRKIEQDLGFTGPEILFWDDDPRNVRAARSLGWHAEDYTTLACYTEVMTVYGLA